MSSVGGFLKEHNMAEPLTSTDIIRERMGFGVSPLASGETRQAYAEAGLSPLGTQQRERFEAGRGISPMATRAEKDAWVASEVMAGRRDPMDLPKAYGGMGERPEATTRRGFRMQQEWDKQYEMMQEQQKIAREMEAEQESLAIQRSQEARMVAEQDAARKAGLAKEFREEEASKQAQNAMNSVMGYTRPDGVRVSPININDENAVERIQSVMAMNPFGMEKQYVKETLGGLLNDALKVRDRNIQQSQQQELEAAKISAATKRPFEEFGSYDERGMFKPNLSAIADAGDVLKAEEASKAEERAIATETRRAEAQANVAEEKNITSQEREIQKEIRRATEDLRKLNASLAGRKSLSATQQSSLQAAKDNLIDKQIDKAALRGFAFDNQEDFKAAKDAGKIPSGVRAFIGRIAIDIP
jgi:hypothetical protein